MKNYFFAFLCATLSLLSACNDGDDFSSDPSLRLKMSADIVDFGTVFTEIGSPTKRFKIYNRNNKSLTIQSVRLKNAATSGFMINIDGEKGTELYNVDILKKDSLFAFVEVNIDQLQTDNPVIVRDVIEFTTNGNVEEVQLEAVGQNVHMWKNKVIASDTTLTNNKPYLIRDSLVIAKNTTIHITEGVTFLFHKGASLHIHGTVEAMGTIDKPITLRGDRLDYIDANIPYDNVSGQWDGIYFYPESYGNHLENVRARNANIGMMFYESNPNNKKARLKNVMVQNTAISGVTAINCNIDATNSLFCNSKGAALYIMGGRYNFLHCTIANYYKWSTRQKHTLILSNTLELSKTLPLTECNITNSILYGNAKTELSLAYSSSVPFEYKFENSLIKYTIENNDRFVNIVWNKDPLFKELNEQGNYKYDFDIITDSSPVIDKAGRTAALLAPWDIRGRLRVDNVDPNRLPDIGCYEFDKK